MKISTYNSNWKINNTKDWLKCHLIFILLFSLLPIAAGLVAGFVTNNFSIIYPLPLVIPWFILMKLFSLLIVFTIQWMIDHFKRKKHIMLVSIILNMLQAILYIVPIIIMAIVDFFCNYYFDVYMIIAIYIYLTIINFVIEYVYNKYFFNKNN